MRRKLQPSKNELCENHHIIPICMGGGHEIWNTIMLPIREHYVAHLLLSKMYSDNIKVQYSFGMFSHGRGKTLTSSQFKKTRTKLHTHNPMFDPKIVQKAKMNRQISISNPRYCKICQTKLLFKQVHCCSSKCSTKYSKDKTGEVSKKCSQTAKERLAKLTPEQLSTRTKNSLNKCDNKKRIQKITQTKQKNFEKRFLVFDPNGKQAFDITINIARLSEMFGTSVPTIRKSINKASKITKGKMIGWRFSYGS